MCYTRRKTLCGISEDVKNASAQPLSAHKWRERTASTASFSYGKLFPSTVITQATTKQISLQINKYLCLINILL